MRRVGIFMLAGLAGWTADAAPAPEPPTVCVDVPDGEACVKRCTQSTECQVDHGELCDARLHACLLPNTAAIAVPSCPAPPVAHDAAFSPTRALTSAATAGTSQHGPSAVTLGDGSLVVLAASRGGGLALARIDRTGGTQVDLPFPPAAVGAADPDLARGPSGRVYAVWREANAVRLATSSDGGGTWTSSTDVTMPADCDGIPDCALAPRVLAARGADARDRVYILYGAGGLRVRASRDGGATFGTARTALPGSIGGGAIAADGALFLVALDGTMRGAYGSADQAIGTTVSRDGGDTFARPATVTGRDDMVPFVNTAPAIAVDSAHQVAYIAYVRGGADGAWDVVLAVRSLAGKAGRSDDQPTWARVALSAAKPCALHLLPALAIDPASGALHVIATDSVAGGRVMHSICKPRAKACTEAGRLDDVPFATLTTMRESDRALGPSASLVVDNLHRRIHAVWTQPLRAAGSTPIATRIVYTAGTLPKRR